MRLRVPVLILLGLMSPNYGVASPPQAPCLNYLSDVTMTGTIVMAPNHYPNAIDPTYPALKVSPPVCANASHVGAAEADQTLIEIESRPTDQYTAGETMTVSGTLIPGDHYNAPLVILIHD